MHEIPSKYYIHKLELLELVYDYIDTELIGEILDRALVAWHTVLTPNLYSSIVDLQNVIHYYEDILIHLEGDREACTQSTETKIYTTEGGLREKKSAFPRDNSIKSKQKIPQELGKQLCRHCSSPFHWKYECPHSKKGRREVRVNFVHMTNDELDNKEHYYWLQHASDRFQRPTLR